MSTTEQRREARRRGTRRRSHRSRLWRATAYVVDPTAPNGRRREVAGRTSATTQDGLARFVNAHRRQGHAVDVIRVVELEELLA